MENTDYNSDYPPHNNGSMSRAELVQKFQDNSNWVNNSGGSRAYLAYRDFSNQTFAGLNASHSTMAFTNCQGANFSNCNFKESNFRRANLSGANLSGCNLSFCNFMEADLTGVNLTNCSIYNTIGNGKQIKNFYISKFFTTYTSEHVVIGCMSHPLQWWKDCTLADIEAVYGEEDAPHMLDQYKQVYQSLSWLPVFR